MWPGRGGRLDHEVRRQRLRRLKRRDVLRDLQVVDEALVEPRVLAARERVGHHVERGVAGREVRRREPGEVNARQLHFVGDRPFCDAVQRDAGGGVIGSTAAPGLTSPNHFSTSFRVATGSMSPATTRLALLGA